MSTDSNSENAADKRPKLGTKTKGAITAMAFLCECARRGGIVSVPLADDHCYDLVVDNRTRLFRVQVKKSSCDKSGRFSFGSARRKMKYVPSSKINGNDGNATASGGPYELSFYRSDEIDYVVTEVVGHWYFYTPEKLYGKINVSINPKKPNPARDKWDALGLRRNRSKV